MLPNRIWTPQVGSAQSQPWEGQWDCEGSSGDAANSWLAHQMSVSRQVVPGVGGGYGPSSSYFLPEGLLDGEAEMHSQMQQQMQMHVQQPWLGGDFIPEAHDMQGLASMPHKKDATEKVVLPGTSQQQPYPRPLSPAPQSLQEVQQPPQQPLPTQLQGTQPQLQPQPLQLQLPVSKPQIQVLPQPLPVPASLTQTSFHVRSQQAVLVPLQQSILPVQPSQPVIPQLAQTHQQPTMPSRPAQQTVQSRAPLAVSTPLTASAPLWIPSGTLPDYQQQQQPASAPSESFVEPEVAIQNGWHGPAQVNVADADHLEQFAGKPNRWHGSAQFAGELSQDGHIFTKTKVGPQKRFSEGVVLSSISMVFEQTLRLGGVHRYRYSILEGTVGAADGVGFVFDSRIRRNNIKRMRSVFLNKNGQVCVRDLERITKLSGSFPKLTAGMCVTLHVDLDRATARFEMEDALRRNIGVADLSFAELVNESLTPLPPSVPAPVRAGFFCAVLTDVITVSLY